MKLFAGLRGTTRTGLMLAGVAAVMVSLSFAAVPFYDWFCRTTGYAGTTGVAEKAPDTILDQTIRVRFDASVERGMPWEFRPAQREMTLRIGETGMAFFEAHNPTNHVVAGTASYNVTPDAAGRYFEKIACFCFDMQVLQPGERVQMPVTFFVDPGLVTDAEGRFVQEITLSYTFHVTELPEEQAALAPATPAPVN
jgi:cytochrome c oxidase assembly protein subunit 11